MRIATYNILKGGSQRVHWAKMIEEHSVDLLLLQESYTPDEHLPPLKYPEARSRSVWKMVEKNGWGRPCGSRPFHWVLFIPHLLRLVLAKKLPA